MKTESQAQIKEINSVISRITSMYTKWSHKNNMSYYAMGILYSLITEGSITQKKYIDDFDVPKQSINNVISSLKNDGYIVMQKSKTDGREKIIILTDKGRDYASTLLSPLFQIEDEVVEKMGKGQMRELIRLMTMFSDCLEQNMEKETT